MDCGLYWSQRCEQLEGTVTLLLDKSITSLLDGSTASHKDELETEIVRIIEVGEQHGIEIEGVLPFYTKWQKQSNN